MESGITSYNKFFIRRWAPIQLHGTDITILQALMKDGRKSFLQISHNPDVNTSTVKSRFDRLVKTRLIRGNFSYFQFQINRT